MSSGFFTRIFTLKTVFVSVLAVAALGALWPVLRAEGVDAVEAAPQMRETRLVPHKALYDIQLAGKKSGSQVVNISGQMLYEWQPSCDAWISNHRFNLFYEYADSPPLQVTSDFSTVESFDGKTLNFTSQRKRDGILFEELRGNAEIGKDGAGEAVYRLPKGLEFDLAAGSLFPMGHTLKVLEAVRNKQKFFTATIFDGSDAEGPVEVNAFIGKPVNVMAKMTPSEDLDASLINTPAWNVRLAYFPLSREEASSDYEMDLVFHDNGVISDMFIEYDDFSVTQKLVALEKMESTCKSETAK